MNLFSQNDEDVPAGTLEEEDEGGGFSFDLSPELQIAVAFGATLLVGFICALTILPALRPEPVPTPAPTQPVQDFEEPTAREAYDPAVRLIRETDPGAQLAGGAGQWTPVINQVQLDAGRTGWTFFFYLPASQEMAKVVVDRGKQARVAEVEAWETPPNLLNDQRWQADSPQAMSQALQSCQDTLAEAGPLKVQARLSAAAVNRTLLWTVSFESVENPLDLCEVNIDATTGLPLQ